LKEVKNSLNNVYGERVKDIILYGSYARGEATEDSEIDIIILLNNLKGPGEEIAKCLKPIWEIEFKHDTLISILPIEEKDFKIRKMPVILNAKKEGISIWK